MNSQMKSIDQQWVCSRVDQAKVIAILRGLTPDRAVEVCSALLESGVTVVEVPLNSPQPYNSIELIRREFGQHLVCGAGTVTQPEQVKQVSAAGGQIVLSPNMQPSVIKACAEYNILSIPGVATPTEAFNAIEAGATYLKLFPASIVGKEFIQAIKAVLPKTVSIIAVGGIDITSIESWINAGAIGVGLGSQLYKSDDLPQVFKSKLAQLQQQLEK